MSVKGQFKNSKSIPMKTALHLFFICFFSITLSAQSTITIKINHLLNDEVFELNVDSKNDMDNDFKVDRLEYYLSTFSITHDGGEVTPIEDLYVLVDMGNKVGEVSPTLIELGELDVQNIESVNFYFGIDEEANHADPALWPIGHPLAPKFPSMHWGWAAGYRFIALEGLSGPNVDQELQFHCIGDEFYEEMSFPVSMSGKDEYTIEIDAEYSNLLSQIDVSDGLILHGNLNEIQTLATNLKEKVFTAAEVTSVDDSELVKSFEVFPNPSSDGFISLKTNAAGNNNVVKIFDAMGRSVLSTSMNMNNIEIQQSGIYYVSLMDNQGKTLATRKVIIQ